MLPVVTWLSLLVLQALIPPQFAETGMVEVFVRYRSTTHVVDISIGTTVNQLRDVLSDILSLGGLDDDQWWFTFRGDKLEGDTLVAGLGTEAGVIKLTCVSQGLQVFIHHDDLERAVGQSPPFVIRPQLFSAFSQSSTQLMEKDNVRQSDWLMFGVGVGTLVMCAVFCSMCCIYLHEGRRLKLSQLKILDLERQLQDHDDASREQAIRAVRFELKKLNVIRESEINTGLKI